MDKKVRLFSLANPLTITVVGLFQYVPSSLALCPDGQLIVGFLNGAIGIYRKGRELTMIRIHQSSVACVAVHPSAKFMLSGSADHMISLFNFGALDEYATLKAHQSVIDCINWCHDGVHFATGDASGKIIIWKFPAATLLVQPEQSRSDAGDVVALEEEEDEDDTDMLLLHTSSSEGQGREEEEHGHGEEPGSVAETRYAKGGDGTEEEEEEEYGHSGEPSSETEILTEGDKCAEEEDGRHLDNPEETLLEIGFPIHNDELSDSPAETSLPVRAAAMQGAETNDNAE
jgi:hypothetical protein